MKTDENPETRMAKRRRFRESDGLIVNVEKADGTSSVPNSQHPNLQRQMTRQLE